MALDVLDAPAPVTKKLSLPALIASKAEVGRLVNELEFIDDKMHQLGLRTGGHAVKVPKTSRLLDKVVEHNHLNLLQTEDRQALGKFLENIRQKAPVLHMSFSSDPSPAFIEKMVTWLRREIHPEVLLTVGLQPSLGAGCIVRGNSKYFDFSLKEDFAKKRDLLAARLLGEAKT